MQHENFLLILSPTYLEQVWLVKICNGKAHAQGLMKPSKYINEYISEFHPWEAYWE